MLSFAGNTAPCEVREQFIFTMPRVVPDQRAMFENDELFRKLSRDSEVKYTGHRDRPIEERQLRFQAEVREGHADLAFVSTGTNLQLNFVRNSWSERPEERVPTLEFVNFDQEPGKVHLKSQFILNGVCVVWTGWVDEVRLEGVGCLQLDEGRAQVEDALLREQIEQNNRRVQEFEDRRRQRQQEQERQAASEAEQVRSRRKSRPRRDVHTSNTARALSSTSSSFTSSSSTSSSSTSSSLITVSTAATTTTISTPLPTIQEGPPPVTVISEPELLSSKQECSPRMQFNRVRKCKHREIQVADEEEEVDVVAIEGDTETTAGVSRVVGGTRDEADIVAPPRDKIRKSDTIWSPWK